MWSYGTSQSLWMDGQLVSLEMSSSIRGVSALGAFKRFLTAMNQHMSFQIARTTCCVVTLIATEGLDFNVQRLLRLFCIIIRLCFHVFIAKQSFKLCYVSRDRKLFKRRNRLMLVLFPFMTSHIRISVKSRWAKGALVFLFIFMNFHMILVESCSRLASILAGQVNREVGPCRLHILSRHPVDVKWSETKEAYIMTDS